MASVNDRHPEVRPRPLEPGEPRRMRPRLVANHGPSPFEARPLRDLAPQGDGHGECPWQCLCYCGYQLGLRFSRKLAMPSIASGVFGLCGVCCARMADKGGEANRAEASFSAAIASGAPWRSSSAMRATVSSRLAASQT